MNTSQYDLVYNFGLLFLLIGILSGASRQLHFNQNLEKILIIIKHTKTKPLIFKFEAKTLILDDLEKHIFQGYSLLIIHEQYSIKSLATKL